MVYKSILSRFKKHDCLKLLRDDPRGFLFSTDLLLSLIILTIIIGISADAMDYSSGTMGEHMSRTVLERCTIEAADILIKTPGSPDNWETSSNNMVVSPGLALNHNDSGNYSSNNIISFDKINNLSQNYDNLMKSHIFPPNIKSNLIIFPLDERINPLIVHNETLPQNADEVVVVNRSVQCDFFSNYTVIFMNWEKNNQKISNMSDNISNTISYTQSDICPHNSLNSSLNHEIPINSSSDKIWKCYHFNTNLTELEEFNFYLITDPSHICGESSYWILDTADNISSENKSFSSNFIDLNKEIKEKLGSKENITLWIHVIGPENPTNPFKVYLVKVPGGIDIKYLKAEYFKPQICNFILQTWTDI